VVVKFNKPPVYVFFGEKMEVIINASLSAKGLKNLIVEFANNLFRNAGILRNF